MRNRCIALVVSGLIAVPAGASLAQDASSQNQASLQLQTLASMSMPDIRKSYMVFLQGNNTLPPSAAETVKKAAQESRSKIVTIEGREDQANAVKRELMRYGVPESSIMWRPERSALKDTPDGIPNPSRRVVEIKL